ncbi:TIGR03621 family F420-dependent LLM class oxidoreductase [Hamadaea sp. NPDC051192]|uniref:TIGR03621 family F420-dependent LLM class oxidoreductase n=1 Tax=Hamadaea sp. NPDC051192 TaxID=3154940 RepID=UPI00343C2BEC
MTRPFRFIAPMPRLTVPPLQWRAELRRLEDLGFHTVAVSDHFTQGWMMEPIVAMTAAAEATTTLRVLSLVLGNDYRHPVLLHKAMATLDVLSGGRVEIGLGAGWLPGDYQAAGLQLDSPGVRIARLAESVQVVKGLFGSDPLTFAGRHYRITELDGLPKPVQRPHPPILVGGGSRKVLGLAGQLADIVGVNPSLKPDAAAGSAVLDLTEDRVAEKIAWAKAGATAAGRDPAVLDFQISVLSLDVTDVPGAQRWTSSLAQGVDPQVLAASPAVLHGPAAYCAEQLHKWREVLGLNQFHLGGDPVAAAAVLAKL